MRMSANLAGSLAESLADCARAKPSHQISRNDLLIAAQVLATVLMRVTTNMREIERVPSLRVENRLLE